MILHLFKKDLRRTRVLLFIWLLLVVLQCALIGTSARPGDQVMQGVFYFISMLVPVFQTLMLVVIIPLLVQEEPLVGTTAFWYTRPLKRSSIMGAKALFAVLLILLPLLAEVAMLITHRVTLHDITLAIPEIILNRLQAVVLLAVLAVLTPTFSRFMIAGVILMVTSLLLSAIFTLLPLWLHPESVMALANNLSLIKSRGVAQGVLIILGGGTIIAHQYLTRKSGRSLILAGCAAAGFVSIQNFWSWNFLATPASPDFSQNADLSKITISLKHTNVQEISPIRGIGEPQKSIICTLETNGLPAGCVAIAKKVHPSLKLPDGNPVPTHDPNQNYYSSSKFIDAIEFALSTPVVNPGYLSTGYTPLLGMDPDIYRRNVSQPLVLTADVNFIAAHYTVVAELSLTQGAHFEQGSENMIITDVLRQGDGVEIVVQARHMQLLFDRENSDTNNTAVYSMNGKEDVYLLVNKKRNQAVLTKQNSGMNFSFDSLTNNSRLLQRSLRLPFGREQNNLAPELNEAWLADAKLVRLHLTPIGEFSKQLIVEKFKLDGSNAPLRKPLAAVPIDKTSLPQPSLPKNPTKAQVKEYVEGILINSQRNGTYRTNEPQDDMLVKVGANNVDVLFDIIVNSSGPTAFHLETAILKLARAEDKELVLQLLPTHNRFIALVTKYSWKTEAHNILIDGLKDKQANYLAREWIQAVASFEEPATYPALKAYLLRCSNKQETFNAIRKLPDIDLKETVDAAWENVRTSSRNSEVVDACGMAAAFGHLDALDALVRVIKTDEEEPRRKHAANILKKYTPATGDEKTVIAWYEAHRDQLIHRPKHERFILRQESSSPETPQAESPDESKH